ncbi:MAG: L-lactate permease [Chloroflexi bacterium]|nr:L-lactate permease [Chloroflexota bacterium]
MNLPDATLLNVLLAASPIIVVLYLMIGRDWSGSEAGWLVGLRPFLSACSFWGKHPPATGLSRGSCFALLYVLYVIWMALLLYHTVNDAGAIFVIGQQMPRLAHDQPAQALLLAWIFGSFLQGATGFGVPAAIVAPLLVGLGFEANVAVTMALLGHAWAVTFGSLGSSFLSLNCRHPSVWRCPGQPGGVDVGSLLCAVRGGGVVVIWPGNGRSSARVVFVGPGCHHVHHPMVDRRRRFMDVGCLWRWPGRPHRLHHLLHKIQKNRHEGPRFNTRRFLQAFFPYAILIVVIVLGQVFLEERLGFLQLNLNFPAVNTSFGWTTAAGAGRSISIFGHAGRCCCIPPSWRLPGLSGADGCILKQEMRGITAVLSCAKRSKAPLNPPSASTPWWPWPPPCHMPV